MIKTNFHILMIEDDAVDIMNIQRAFKKNNIHYPLEIAGNGVEALSMLRGTGDIKAITKPQVILLDLNMPKMGGIEFLRELRQDPHLKDISVFVMTTSNEERDKKSAYQYQVAGYILKPLEMDEFIRAIAILDEYWRICEYPADCN